MGAQALFPEVLRVLAQGSGLTTTYAAIGTPLVNPCRIIRFLNTSDQLVTISWDGVNAHMILPSNSFILLDVSVNTINYLNNFISANQQFYAKTALAPTLGAVYLEAYFN